jgi:hypothetical protein
MSAFWARAMRWRIAPLGVAGLFIVLGINAWLLTAIATEVVHESLAATDKVDWNVNLSASVGNAATRKPIEANRKSWLARFFSSPANRSFPLQRHRRRLWCQRLRP